MQQTPSGKDSRDDPSMTPGCAPDVHNGTDGRHADKAEKGDGNGAVLSEDNDTETDEAELQDHALTTIATGLANAQGDFFFGDGEMDPLHVDYEQMATFDMMQQDWTLPNEAFNLRHEIEDRSPPPEQFPNNCSVSMVDGKFCMLFDLCIYLNYQKNWLISKPHKLCSFFLCFK